MIENRIRLYEVKLFELEMDRAASEANGDEVAVHQIGHQMNGILAAIEAIRKIPA